MLGQWILSVSALLQPQVNGAATDTNGSNNITSDTYFYGQSPPVYPSPKGTGAGGWAESYAKAAELVAQMTLFEKVCLLSELRDLG
jgi:beta-glucosidase